MTLVFNEESCKIDRIRIADKAVDGRAPCNVIVFVLEYIVATKKFRSVHIAKYKKRGLKEFPLTFSLGL